MPELKRIGTEVGFKEISVSHRVMPLIEAVPRGITTVVDAYLTPSIKQYVDKFKSGFKNENYLKISKIC